MTVAPLDRRPSPLVAILVVVAVIVVTGAVVRFVIGTIVGAIRLLAVIAVGGLVIAVLLARRGDD